MIYVYYLLVALFIFFIILVVSDLNIGVLILKNDEREEIIINIRALFGLIKYRMELPFIQLFKKGQAINNLQVNSDIEMSNQEVIKDHKKKNFTFKEIKKGYHNVKLFYKRYSSVITYVHEKVSFDEIQWETVVGTGDAAVTAFTTGLCWTIKTNLIAFIDYKKEIKDVSVKVLPCYQGEKFNTSLSCIITLKIGYIIIAALKILYKKIKGW